MLVTCCVNLLTFRPDPLGAVSYFTIVLPDMEQLSREEVYKCSTAQMRLNSCREHKWANAVFLWWMSIYGEVTKKDTYIKKRRAYSVGSGWQKINCSHSEVETEEEIWSP